ncbi:MAG TPA: BatA domain-containing protein, partial [Gemmatimonadaceae bacterium]|nr:BatA domain-containing protein [Gemmatimonadaceae bacterium]
MSDLVPGLFFGTPWALLLLLALPAWWILRRARRPAAIVFSRADALAQMPRAGRGVSAMLFLFRNLLLVGLIVALARPRTGAREEPVTTEGINIVLAIDLS